MRSGITWRRTFPECEPGTDGVALFEGRVIGRLRLLAELPRDPRPWMWERGYRRQGRASQAADPSRRNIVNLALCQLPQAVFSLLERFPARHACRTACAARPTAMRKAPP